MEESLPVGNHPAPGLRPVSELRGSRISGRHAPGFSVQIRMAAIPRRRLPTDHRRTNLQFPDFCTAVRVPAHCIQRLIAHSGYEPSVPLSLMICQWSSRYTQYWRFLVMLW